MCSVRCSTCTTRKINGYFFSPLYAMHDMLHCAKKKMQRIWKGKKNQNAFIYGCKRVSKRCGSYMMYLNGDGLHQTIMIVCDCSWFSYIIIFIWWDTHDFLQKFYTQHATLCYSWYYCTCTMWFGHHKKYTW